MFLLFMCFVSDTSNGVNYRFNCSLLFLKTANNFHYAVLFEGPVGGFQCPDNFDDLAGVNMCILEVPNVRCNTINVRYHSSFREKVFKMKC